MRAKTGLELPQGTTVYCGARGLVLDLSWASRFGTHILRTELPFDLCEPGRRPALRAAARDFRRVARLQGYRR